MASSTNVVSFAVSFPSLRPKNGTSLVQRSVQFQLRSPFLNQSVKLRLANNGCNISNAAKRSSLITSEWNFWPWSNSERPSKVQELVVYEFNERDRGSPVYLRLANKDENSLGDIVTFTNKTYSGDLTKRLGITTGILLVINIPGKTIKGKDDYETTISFYFGDYGHISAQGSYKSYDDTWMAVTGGTGIFQGVYGQVKCSNVLYPLTLHYIFKLQGIATLPAELTRTPVTPTPNVKPEPQAKACEPHGVVSNYTQ